MGVLESNCMSECENCRTQMAEETRELNDDEMEGIAGGKVTIRIPINTRRLRQLISETKGSGGSLDSALDQCKDDEERKFVSKEWNHR